MVKVRVSCLYIIQKGPYVSYFAFWNHEKWCFVEHLRYTGQSLYVLN
jgi:hypothetical protein